MLRDLQTLLESQSDPSSVTPEKAAETLVLHVHTPKSGGDATEDDGDESGAAQGDAGSEG